MVNHSIFSVRMSYIGLNIMNELVFDNFKWRRATPPVAPVGAANASPEIPKIAKTPVSRWISAFYYD